MRTLFALLILALPTALPTVAPADEFTLGSAPNAVTIYAQGARVTRSIAVVLPAGAHQITLPDLPQGLELDQLRLSVAGATLGVTSFRRDAVAPPPPRDTPDVIAARDAIKAATRALQVLEDRIATARLAARAAEAKAAFLADLGRNEGLPADTATLREMAQLVEDETLSAQQTALSAEQSARALNDNRESLDRDLKDAKAALAALTPPAEDAAQLTFAVTAQTAGQANITLTYYIDEAMWQPVYDVYLDDTATPRLTFQRGAMVRQASGENWNDITLKLSSLLPIAQTAPSQAVPIRRLLADKAPPQLQKSDAISLSGFAEPMLEAPIVFEEFASISTDGPGVTYQAPGTVSVATGVDAARIALGALEFDARRFARAVPRRDTTAFLMAEFTNTTAEPLLPSDTMLLFVDDTLVGHYPYFEGIAAGAEGTLPFGPIEDLRLTRTVLNENNGGRGFISKSNIQSEAARLEVKNIGATPWQVELLAAVPYTVDEDLQITWTAAPQPDVQNVDDQRGVMQWNLDVAAGGTATITLEHELRWPEDKLLR